ncbi:MAG: enoyl-CoA hydratase [Candidatus Fischerbacteria bacterium RBG_13_37_8]|uniref:Enoyl-CoA hydratase n=1 Tax=Candidatus Fischerbacteria bacterium RBG_13_37_8 TaxID=1817863 RepID=A0A1F5VU53_9BACT|nr:MAG: enoyl-CoA hydratase [Candidatus Fischerbacteria bacterium RBG_13_37_8]
MPNKQYQTITFAINNQIALINLNRPDIHNAFNDIMLEELLSVYQEIAANNDVRIAVLTGNGQSFCAGADVNWMKRVKDYSYDENLRESLTLAELLHVMYTLPQPTIARVNGAAIGGGAGLVAVCDIAIASEKAKFSLTEVKIGLVPACISPYVIKRVGERGCRELFLTGERIDGHRAKEYGLVNQVTTEEKLDEAVDNRIKLLLSSGPNAIAICKDLLQKVPKMNPDEYKQYTAEVIAKLRISKEGQEGMSAFLEKRKPKWSI